MEQVDRTGRGRLPGPGGGGPRSHLLCWTRGIWGGGALFCGPSQSFPLPPSPQGLGPQGQACRSDLVRGRPPTGSLASACWQCSALGRPGALHAHVGTCGLPRAGHVLISPLSWEFLLKAKQTKKVLVLPGFLPDAKWVLPWLLGASGSGGIAPLGFFVAWALLQGWPLPGVQAPCQHPGPQPGWEGAQRRFLWAGEEGPFGEPMGSPAVPKAQLHEAKRTKISISWWHRHADVPGKAGPREGAAQTVSTERPGSRAGAAQHHCPRHLPRGGGGFPGTTKCP